MRRRFTIVYKYLCLPTAYDVLGIYTSATITLLARMEAMGLAWHLRPDRLVEVVHRIVHGTVVPLSVPPIPPQLREHLQISARV